MRAGEGSLRGSLAAGPALSGAGAALVILCAVGFLNYLDRMILAATLPAIMRDFQLSDSQAGLLSTGFGIVYAIAGLVLGRASDRLQRNRLILGALALWSAATVLCGLATTYNGLMLARMGVALGEAAFLPAAFSMLSDYYPRERRHWAMTRLVVCVSLGTAVGLALGGVMTASFGWRSAFLVAGGPGLAIAAIGLLALREPRRERVDGEGAMPMASAIDTLATLARNRLYVWLVLTTGLNGFSAVGIVQWLPSHFARSFDVSLGEIGLAFGLGFGVGTAGGHLLGGLAAGRLAGRSASAPLFLPLAANLLVIPGYLAALSAGSLPLAAVLAFVTAITAALGAIAQSVGLQNAVHPLQRGIAQAMSGMLVSLMGLALGPLAVGVLSDQLARSIEPSEALRWALIWSQLFFVLASFTAWRAYLAARRLEESVARQPVP